MKSHRILAFTALLAIATVSRADEGEALAISTIGGQTYSRCQVVHLYPDGVAFRHSRGMAKIQFTDLTPGWRKHFGYDAAKVEAYERKVLEDRAKEREIAAASAAARQKAWNEAYVQQLQALAVAEALGGGQGGYGYGFLDVGLGGDYGLGCNNNGFNTNRGHGWGRNVGNNYNYGLGNYSWITKPQYPTNRGIGSGGRGTQSTRGFIGGYTTQCPQSVGSIRGTVRGGGGHSGGGHRSSK